MSAQPPSPEKIASWEAQALALMSTRTAPEKVIAHLKYVGCPASLAQDIVSRNRRPATKNLRRKGVGILLTGVAILGGVLLLELVKVLIGMPIPLPINAAWFAVLGAGMIVYGVLQIVFG